MRPAGESSYVFLELGERKKRERRRKRKEGRAREIFCHTSSADNAPIG
jgi:hypothetical protein